jgi:hypothetical protein
MAFFFSMLKDARHCIFRNEMIEQMYGMLETSTSYVLCHLNIVRSRLVLFVTPQFSNKFCGNCG